MAAGDAFAARVRAMADESIGRRARARPVVPGAALAAPSQLRGLLLGFPGDAAVVAGAVGARLGG
jgi:hypothetical protein